MDEIAALRFVELKFFFAHQTIFQFDFHSIIQKSLYTKTALMSFVDWTVHVQYCFKLIGFEVIQMDNNNIYSPLLVLADRGEISKVTTYLPFGCGSPLERNTVKRTVSVYRYCVELVSQLHWLTLEQKLRTYFFTRVKSVRKFRSGNRWPPTNEPTHKEFRGLENKAKQEVSWGYFSHMPLSHC